MTINEIFLGSGANDGTGTNLRAGGEIINDNFSDPANAASKLVGTAQDEIPLNSDLGDASLATVQTSPTDTTAGALMAVGAFGVGGEVDLRGTIYDTGQPQDLYGSGEIHGMCTNTNLGIPDLAAGSFGELHISVQWNNNSVSLLPIYSRTFSREFAIYRQYALNGTTWSAWQRTDPQAFGWGGTTKLKPTSDLDTYPDSGSYAYDDNTGSAPSVENGIVLCEFRDPTTAGLRATQKALTTSGLQFSRNNIGGTWDATWQPVYTGVNYQPETVNGLGVPIRLYNTGGSVASGATAAAGTLFTYVTDSAGNLTTTGGSALGGTHICIGKGTVAGSRTGDFVKVA